jgi:hypothetical protein
MNFSMTDEPRDAAPPTPSAHERFESLWTDYLEGLLDADGIAELDALLAFDERLVSRATDLYQTHRRLGLLAEKRPGAAEATGDAFVADVMGRLQADGEALTRRIMERLEAMPPRAGVWRPRSSWRGLAAPLLVGVVAVMALAIVAMTGRLVPPTETVRFVSLARARFLGRDTPAHQEAVVRDETYVLSGGVAEIAFPLGATAVVEAPAVFRVCGSDCLAVDSGRCSVHAPDGAEGFRVETPATRVIDRGTRFVVSVGETADTEVRVIEGAADVIEKGSKHRDSAPLRLSAGESARIDPATGGRITLAQAAAIDVYRGQAPDRLISYTASLRYSAASADRAVVDVDPGVDTLEGVTVQRGGRVMSYRADQLIGVQVVHFRVGNNVSNLVSPGTADWTVDRIGSPDVRRAFLESDRLLTTGMINPGGSQSPPSSDPLPAVMPDDAATPGIAVRFTRPVVNGPGPDVIFFDLQMLNDPPQGDAFHVGPPRSAAGLGWHTVSAYDIDSTSPESLLLARCRLFQLATKATTLDDLLAAEASGGHVLPVRARGNAVGIDLSDLGYAAGASCDGLFFQDAADDSTTVDPTFIAGLPMLDGPAGEAGR